MKKKHLAVILGTIILIVGSLTVVFTKTNNNDMETNKKTYSENHEDKMTIEANAEITNADDAYKTAIFYKEDFINSNKDKISAENSDKIQVIIKGKYKSWLYDGTGSVKEIDTK